MNRTLSTAAGLLFLLASAGAHAAITPASCDSKSYQAVQSRAAASFDAFDDYRHRSLAFRDAIAALSADVTPDG